MAKRTRTSDYDELLASYYGGSPDRLRRLVRKTPYSARPNALPTRAMSVSVAQDDGELLLGPAGTETPPEYLVTIQPVGAVRGPIAPVAPAQPGSAVLPSAPLRAALPEPLPVLEPPARISDAAPAAAELPALPELTNQPVGALTDNELLADMQQILSGSSSLSSADPAKITDAPPRRSDSEEPPASPTSNEHAFFDRLAASMEYANTYDLGSVDLQRKFADFDRLAELPGRTASRPAAYGASAASGDTADFIRDLEAIKSGQVPPNSTAGPVPGAYRDPKPSGEDLDGWSPACRPMSLHTGETGSTGSGDDGSSHALYDTGEHVLAGGDLYPDALHVGPAPGVPFSYGQIIGLGGDLAGAPEEMAAMPLGTLTRLKQLIDQSTRYYAGGKKDRSLDVTNSTWDTATDGNYLSLAERNYEHFAPHTLPVDFTGSFRFGNHKEAWEFYHRTAIEQAQRYYAAGGDFPEQALIRNAFGDHFLTDAFAAGHLFNKEVVIALFKRMFYNGSALNPMAEKFFDQLAENAFTGEARKRFSALETVDYPVCVWGFCLKWHPNIDSTSRFASLLKAAATQQPDKIANMSAKALHDHLNKTGLTVTNAAGDGVGSPWHLQGDGNLNAMTKAIMRTAVAQSAANITDPAIRAGGGDVAAFQAKVWRFAPQLTAGSRDEVVRLIHEYTNPDSQLLVNDAAVVLKNNLDTLIKELLEQKKLKVA
jgi:hypothetical protein